MNVVKAAKRVHVVTSCVVHWQSIQTRLILLL